MVNKRPEEMTREELLKFVRQNAVRILESDQKKIRISYKNMGYSGEFEFRYPSLLDRVKVGVERAKLLDGADGSSVDATTDNIVHMFSTLTVSKEVAPDWFSLESLDDYRVLEEIYDEFVKQVDNFRSLYRTNGIEGNSEVDRDENVMEVDGEIQVTNQ